MGTFFHGWRRKAGGVTLVMACAFTVVWMRSLDGFARAYVPVGEHTYESLNSCEGLIVWERNDEVPSDEMPSHADWFERRFDRRFTPPAVDEADGLKWHWTWCGFGAYEAQNDPPPLGSGSTIRAWVIPHWAIVAAFTLLSAFLLLSRQRPKPERPSP